MARYTIGPKKPNVLICMFDDVGVENVEIMDVGTERLTPMVTIRALIKNSVQFMDAYVNPVCSPTRTMLMTGLNAHQSGIGQIVVDNPPNVCLPTDTRTLAWILKDAGYATGCFGKWHLTNSSAGGDDGPNLLGFDNFSGCIRNIIDPDSYYRWDKVTDGRYVGKGRGWAPAENTVEACDWLEKQKEPWFLYLPFNVGHVPYTRPPDGLYTPDPAINKLQPTGIDDKRLWHLAMVESGDRLLGNVIAKIRQLRMFEDTLVIIMNDNGSGGNHVGLPFSAIPGHDKGTVYRGGTWSWMVIKAPFREGAQNEQCTLLTTPQDIFALVCEYAGMPNEGVGISLRPWLINPALADPRKQVFVHRFKPNGPYPVPGTPDEDERAIISRRYEGGTTYKLITRHSVHAPEELVEFFNLDADPYEASPLSESGATYTSMTNDLNAFLAS